MALAHSSDSPAAVLTRDAMDAVAPELAPGRQAVALAEHFGVTRQTVWAWRAGKRTPPGERVVELARLAGNESRALAVLLSPAR